MNRTPNLLWCGTKATDLENKKGEERHSLLQLLTGADCACFE